MPGTALIARPLTEFGSVDAVYVVVDLNCPTSSTYVSPGQTSRMFCCHWQYVAARPLLSTSARLAAFRTQGVPSSVFWFDSRLQFAFGLAAAQTSDWKLNQSIDITICWYSSVP